MQYHWGLGVGHTYAHQEIWGDHMKFPSNETNPENRGMMNMVLQSTNACMVPTLIRHENPPSVDDLHLIEPEDNSSIDDGDEGEGNGDDDNSDGDDDGDGEDSDDDGDDSADGSEEEMMHEMYGEDWDI